MEWIQSFGVEALGKNHLADFGIHGKWDGE